MIVGDKKVKSQLNQNDCYYHFLPFDKRLRCRKGAFDIEIFPNSIPTVGNNNYFLFMICILRACVGFQDCLHYSH